jgi:hypothetical protein
MTMQRFIDRWTHPDQMPVEVDESGLCSVETHFGFQFPADYREAVRSLGLPSTTIALLDTIVDHDLDVRDVADFLGPAEMIQSTTDWREMGLPATLVAFASDCMGNLFCFPADGASPATGSTPVFFFDHDIGTVETIAPSFGAWLNEFCELPAHTNPTIRDS